MKVNISGKGIVPGLNRLAPVYNCDLSKSAVLRLLNFPKFHVYETATGAYISRSNIDAVFAKATAPSQPNIDAPLPKKQTNTTKPVKKEEVPVEVAEPVTQNEKPKVTPYLTEPVVEEEKVTPVVEEALPEITDDVVTEEQVADVEETTEESAEETVEDTDVEETSEEPTKAYYNTNKKKNKKRHN